MYAGTIVEEPGELVGVEGGRHEDKLEVWPGGQNVLADGHQKVGVNVSFVNLKFTYYVHDIQP